MVNYNYDKFTFKKWFFAILIHSLVTTIGVIGSEEFSVASNILTIFKAFETMNNNSKSVFYIMKWKGVPLVFFPPRTHIILFTEGKDLFCMLKLQKFYTLNFSPWSLHSEAIVGSHGDM